MSWSFTLWRLREFLSGAFPHVAPVSSGAAPSAHLRLMDHLPKPEWAKVMALHHEPGSWQKRLGWMIDDAKASIHLQKEQLRLPLFPFHP